MATCRMMMSNKTPQATDKVATENHIFDLLVVVVAWSRPRSSSLLYTSSSTFGTCALRAYGAHDLDDFSEVDTLSMIECGLSKKVGQS